jgi:hypothetical protein
MCFDCVRDKNDIHTVQVNALHIPDDPIVRFETLFNIQFPMTKNSKTYKPITKGYERKHQTLLVVHVTSNPHPVFMERAIRLATSFNLTSTIKADILSLADGKLYEGLVWTGDAPGGRSEDEIFGFAQEHGYTQTLTLRYSGTQ